MLNRAVMWHLQLCLRLLDRLGYQMAAINVEAAIDALTSEAASFQEISKMDIDRGDRLHLILDFYDKHGKSLSEGTDSQDREIGEGQPRDGNSEDTRFSD